MTAQIGLVAGTDIEVDVLRQDRDRLFADETSFFDEGDGSVGIVREVCLKSNDLPLLVARTVFTSPRLEDHPTIRKLGNHALGSLLFANGPSPYTAREFCAIDQTAPLWPLIKKRNSAPVDSYWARRTLFSLFDEQLLVTEIFMPDLLSHPGVSQN